MDNILAICDCSINANSGEWEVINQRDWTVPNFSMNDFVRICNNADCKASPENKEPCKTCVVTRLKEFVFEEQY